MLSFTAVGTLNSTSILTQGVPGLDFTAATGGACSVGAAYAIGDSCTVNVAFAPVAPGLRMGAVQLFDISGNLLAMTLVPGIGHGPEMAFGPGVQTTVPASGLLNPTGVAVDAAGDVFIADTYNNRVVEVPVGGGAQTTVGSGLNQPTAVAVDGAGDVFIADSQNSRVVEVPVGGGAQTTVGSGLNDPWGVAVDGAGDVFIADTYNNRVVEVPAGGGPQITVGSGLSFPWRVAADGLGNVFVIVAVDNNFNNAVVEVPASGGAQTTLGSGLNYPYGVAVDGAGDVFIADAGNNRVVEVLAGGGTQTTVGSALGSPYGVAVDGAGNVFIAESYNNRVVEVQRGQPPSLTFASTNVGSTSSDSPQSVTVQNIGNQTLTVTGLSVGTNFLQANGSGTPLDCTGSSSLAPGAACNLSLNFVPLSAGTIVSAAIFTDNAFNAPGAMQSVTVQGTGIGQATSSVTVICPTTLQTYTGTALTPCTASYTTSDGLSGTLTLTYTNNTNVGAAGATANYAGDANHVGSSNSGSFTISQAMSSVTVTCSTTPQTYTGTALTPCTASYTASDGSHGTLTPIYANNTNVGMAAATASYGGDANHAGSGNSGSFAIGKATSSVTVTCPLTAAYTGSVLTPCTASYKTSDGSSGSLTTTYLNNVNPGLATTNATYLGDANHAGSSGSGSFTITPILVSLKVTPGTASIVKGLTQPFQATGTYSPSGTQDITSLVTWTSSSPTIAMVIGGLATGLSAGTSTISASLGTISSGAAGSAKLTVTAVKLVSVTVTPVNPTVPKGTTVKFTATGTYTDGTMKTVSATWSSSNTLVAKFNEDGSTVSTPGVGTSTITATSGGIYGTTVITVVAAALQSITVTPSALSIAKGLTKQFTATGRYTDGTTQNLTASVTWSSAPGTGASTISAGGSAAGTEIGTSTITATSGTIAGSTTLTVTTAVLQSIAITPAAPTITKSTTPTEAFIATGTYSDGSMLAIAGVIWSSSNTRVATIASTGIATAVAAGTSTIKAASGNISGTTVLTVK